MPYMRVNAKDDRNGPVYLHTDVEDLPTCLVGRISAIDLRSGKNLYIWVGFSLDGKRETDRYSSRLAATQAAIAGRFKVHGRPMAIAPHLAGRTGLPSLPIERGES